MAKRKRLTPPTGEFVARAPEVKSEPGGAPIAQVAGEAAALSAFAEVAEAMRAARDEGRLIQRIPLTQIRADYLLRDRMEMDAAEFETLKASIAARGQQTPLELVEIAKGDYGLVSGWRRLKALAEMGMPEALAVVRPAGEAGAAYVAMVEENEIRAGLSYYERARLVGRAVEAGVFPSAREALRTLFAAASRAKRSKIGAFHVVWAALDGALRFPARIPERLGLSLAKAIEADAEFAPRLAERLRKTPPEDAQAEQKALERALKPAAAPRPGRVRQELRPGVFLTVEGYLKPKLTLEGPRVTPEFRARLEAWLKDPG